MLSFFANFNPLLLKFTKNTLSLFYSALSVEGKNCEGIVNCFYGRLFFIQFDYFSLAETLSSNHAWLFLFILASSNVSYPCSFQNSCKKWSLCHEPICRFYGFFDL